MARKPRVAHEKARPEGKGTCSHYWIIESPTGPTSAGKCKLCGAVCEFANYVPYASWENKHRLSESPNLLIEPDKEGQAANS